jgi:hypothetical protein
MLRSGETRIEGVRHAGDRSGDGLCNGVRARGLRNTQRRGSCTAGSHRDRGRRPPGGSVPNAAIIAAVVALVVIGIAIASAESDPYLDYSDICGTPDCT